MVVLTFSGLHGAGKSTYAKEIAEEFGLRYVSAGEIFRTISRERGLTIIELTDLAVKDSSIDRQMDDRTRLEAENGLVVLDGQLAGWMAGELADIRVYLRAPLNVRVARLASRDGVSKEEAMKELSHRETVERERYKSMYGIDVDDTSIYEIIIDTGFLSSGSIIRVLKTAVREYISAKEE